MDNELELYVVKRDGKKVPFDRQKIYNAIAGAARECGSTTSDELTRLTDQVVKKWQAQA